MKKIYASLMILTSFFQLNAQFSNDWSRSYVGNGGRIYNKSFIAADATDNAVVSFGFDVIDSLSSTSIPFSHPGGAITVKYSGATGTQTYIKNIEDKYTSLAGQVLQTAGSVTVALTNQSAGGNKDIRVYRYASAGTQTWLNTYNGPGNDNDLASDVTLDLTGNALVTGTFDADNVSTRGLLVYKLNSANGNLLWQKNITSVGSIQNGLKVLTNASSSVYTIYERITGVTKSFGVAGFLSGGTDLYNTLLTINGYTQILFKDFSCDQSGNCYASFFGITNSNSYNLIVIKIDTNGIASNFLSTTLSGDANNANTRIKVEPNSAQILVAYDNLSNNSVELKRYNSSALEVWNNNKALSTLNDVCFGNGVTPNVFLLSTVSGTDGNDISITRYNGGSGSFIGNTNYDIPLSNSIDKGLSINVSGSGNIFTSGTSSITQNGEKVFATRFNATATNQWTKSIVDFSDLNNSISRTSSGEIIVGGNSRNSSNVPAAYVTKYSSSGNELWRFQHGTYSNEINTGARQIASDSNGNIYFAGVETNSNRDIFLFKLNSSGRVIWKSVYNHTSNLEDLVSEIALDNLGNIILVGTTRQTSINRNVLVLKYNSSGNLIWNVSYDGPFASDDFGRSLVINSSNEIYVGCELRNSGNQTDAAILKLDALGNVLWTSINNDGFGDDLAVKIRLDNLENPILLSNILVATGSYNGNLYKVSPSNSIIFSTNFGDNAVNEIINDFSLNSLNQIAVTGQSGNSPIDRNIFTARFSEVGLQNWISTFVGAGNANDFGLNCSISNNGTVYCGGTTKNASSNDDFILLCYDGSGTQQHFFNFGISGSSNEQASQLVFTDTKVFATGFSNSAANNDGLTAAFTLPILTNTAPTISTLATQTICTSVSSNSISITIADEDLNSVVLTGNSSNTSLISNSGLSFGGSGANRTLIITPALNQTGSSTITVTATDNGSLTNQIQFLVNVTGGPAATSIIADGAETFCNGQSVNIIVPPQTGVNYQWLQNGNNVGLNQNTINVSSSGTYSVVLSNNCSSITSSNSIAVTVNNTPNAPTISANGNTTFCTGGSVELSVPSASLVNYQWKIDGNNIGSNSNSLTATSAGVYTVELSNNCGTVASSNSISVIVNSAPTSTTISANGSTTICSGSNLELSVSSQTGVIYQWKIDGSNTGTNSNLLTATAAGVYTVELSNNCGTVVSTNSISVIVNSAPTSTTISANGNTTICSGSSVDLSVSNQSGVNYQWKLDGNNTGTNSNVLSANSAGVYSVVLSNNCGTVAASNTIEVVITTSPLQPTITALGLTEICQGDSVELFVPFNNSLSYQWQLDGNNIFTDTNSVYALIEGIYSLQVTNSCGSVNAVNVIKIDVTEFPIPQTIIANGPNNFCEGGSVLLSTDVIAGVTNLWFLGIDNVGDPGNELIATQSGTYSMVSINLCGIEPSLNTIEVNVTLLPVAPTIVSSSSEIPCNGGSVELSVINQTGVNYSWQQNGNIVGTNSNVFNATTAGTFTVDVSNSCGTEVSNNSITLTAPSLPQAQTITANGSTNFCQGNSVELSVPTEIGASYAWFLNGNTFAGNTNLIVAELPGVYTLEISNNCGISPSNNSVNINVTQAPIAFNIVSSGNVSFCENESVILSTELQSGVTYQWLFNGNNIGTNSNSITASSEGIYSLDVSNNCGTESSGNSIQTTVIPLPISATISINGNTSLCVGENSTLNVPNQAGVNYQWKKDGTNVGTNDNTFDVNEAGIYTIEISNACGTVSSINNIEISITPEPIAQTISASGSVIFCNGGSVELSVPLQVGVSYQWKLNGNNINGNLNSLTANQEGTYSLEISNSCGVVNTLNSILVTILNGPNASIISANGPTTICLGNSVDLSVINQTGVTYQWQIDGNNIGTNSNLLLANQTGIYSLILSNSCGTINSINTIAVNVNSLPNDATIITNGSTTFCNGNSLELSVPFQSGVNFQWKLNGNNIGTNSEIFNATASGNYTIEISNDCGVVTSINSVNILVENTPNATAIIALGPTTFCQGGSVDLTSPLQSGVNYQWKLNGNNVGLNTNSYSASQAGVYTLEIFNSCSTLVSSNSIAVNLNFAPSAQTITANGSTTICSGSFVELSVPLAQFTNYQWKLNGNNIGANANTINATLAGLYTIELSNNCGTSVSLNSIQVNVTVVSAAISASGATSFCNGGSVTLTANSGNSYSWSNSSTSQSINVTSTGSYSVTVSNNNCTATSEPIFINVLNVIPPTISASATEICNGTQAIISSNILPDFQSFAWSNGASGNSINVSVGGNYFVTVTTTSGCTAVSNNIAITVVGPTAPTVSFTGSNIFCEGGSVTLNSNVSSGNNWYFNGALIPGATGNTYVANQTGNYTSQLTGQGCVANSNLISVIVNPKPIASAGIASQNIGAVTFSNNSTNYSSSLWNFGDNTSNSSITNPFHLYLADGTYNVVLTVTNSCGSTSTEITVTILGTAIEELESQTNFAIYPNPFQSNITLSNNNSNSMVGIVTIFDATGKAISYESLNIGPGNNLQMNVENLAKGIYFIEVKTNEYNKTLKLLKQ